MEKKKKVFAGITPYNPNTKKILIVQRSLDISSPLKWCSFGGTKDDDESPLECAKREFKEESGLNLSYQTIRASFDFEMFAGTYINYWGIFDKEFIPKTNKVTDDGVIEIIDYIWLPIESVLKYDLIFGFRKFLEIAAKDIQTF